MASKGKGDGKVRSLEQARKDRADMEALENSFTDDLKERQDMLVAELMRILPDCDQIIVIGKSGGQSEYLIALDDDRDKIIATVTDALLNYTVGTRRAE